MKDIFTHPDEIWLVTENGIPSNKYIKYYNDYPQTIVVINNQVKTLFQYMRKGKLNIDSVDGDRKGILLYRKN